VRTSVIHTLGDTFLRRPSGAVWVADVLRGLVLVTVPIATVGWGPIALAVSMFALLGTVLPRMLGLRPGFDIAVVLLCFVAAWSSTLEWYTTVFLWDKVVHVAFVGVLAMLLVVIASDLGVVTDPRRLPIIASVVLCAAAGLAIGGVWEVFEWAGHTYLDASISVGYEDTIGDLAADVAGAVAGGFVMRWACGDRRIVRRVGTRGA
jgi:hypothetical protein